MRSSTSVMPRAKDPSTLRSPIIRWLQEIAQIMITMLRVRGEKGLFAFRGENGVLGTQDGEVKLKEKSLTAHRRKRTTYYFHHVTENGKDEANQDYAIVQRTTGHRHIRVLKYQYSLCPLLPY
jgi:hypothetical protein